MRLPYGISNFADLRRNGYMFADKSGFIPNLEDATKGRRYLTFLRPRRMGKSLLLSMLEYYYDVIHAAHFDELFAGLAIAAAPTPERGRYAVLRLEMTGMTTTLGADYLRESFSLRLLHQLQRFLDRYRLHMPEVIAAFDAGASAPDPASLMSRFLMAMGRSPHPLYLLIDEYDNFTNDIIARGDHHTYHAAVHASGFVREFYKTIKEGTATGIIGRILMTGVSPVTLDDLTSGFNIMSNVSLDDDLNALAGFTSSDVGQIISEIVSKEGYTLSPEVVVSDLRGYYNGYLFSRRAVERIFNPDMVLHFAKAMAPPVSYPDELLDINVRTDYGRIQRLLFTPEGAPRADAIEPLMTVVTEGSIHARLQQSFPLDRAYEGEFFVSLLYYMGLLTLRPSGGQPRLGIPNYAIRTLYWDAIARLLSDLHEIDVDARRVEAAVEAMVIAGDIAPLLQLVFTKVIQKLSNRDLIRLDEKTMKVLLLAYVSLTEELFAWSEVELGFGYGDLVLVPSKTRPAARYGFLIELKYLKAGATEAMVSARLDEADEQLRRYLADPKLHGIAGEEGWRAVSIAFVGTEACSFRALGGQTSTLTARARE